MAPQHFYSNIQVSTIHEAFVCKSLSIGGISRALNDKDDLTIRALLNIIIADFIQFINVGKTMNGGQLVETVSLVVKHYRHFKPKDFKLCFEEAKKGNYGTFYDRIDGQVILSILKQHDQQRDYVAAEINSNRSEVFKMADKAMLLPESSAIKTDDIKADEVFKTNMARLRQILADNKIAKEKGNVTDQAEKPKDLIYLKSQHWLSQFDELHYLRPVKVKSMRFIKRYGRVLDTNAYLEYKHWQWLTFSNPVNKEKYRNQLKNK